MVFLNMTDSIIFGSPHMETSSGKIPLKIYNRSDFIGRRQSSRDNFPRGIVGLFKFILSLIVVLGASFILVYPLGTITERHKMELLGILVLLLLFYICSTSLSRRVETNRKIYCSIIDHVASKNEIYVDRYKYELILEKIQSKEEDIDTICENSRLSILSYFSYVGKLLTLLDSIILIGTLAAAVMLIKYELEERKSKCSCSTDVLEVRRGYFNVIFEIVLIFHVVEILFIIPTNFKVRMMNKKLKSFERVIFNCIHQHS